MKRPRSFDHESDGESAYWHRRHVDRRFDRRSSGSDRRFMEVDRLHRSESFSSFRRDFPKGFRSDRRDRFGYSSSSSLLRLNSENDRHYQYCDRELKPRDSSSGVEQSKKTAKAERVIKESCSSSTSSEMEEGELLPDPDPELASTETIPEKEDGEMLRMNRIDAVEELNHRKTQEEENDEPKELNVRKMQEEENDGNREDEDCKRRTILKVNLVEEEKGAAVSKEKHADVEAITDTGTLGKSEEGGPIIESVVEEEPSEKNHNNDEVAQPKIVVSEEPQGNNKNNDKSIAVSPACNDHLGEEKVSSEGGPSSRSGFDLSLAPVSAKENSSKISTGKHRDDRLELETLDLSLGLPGFPLDPTKQSMPFSFCTDSNGYTMSFSLSGSQTFLHNPSCSLTQNSIDFEQSVGSRPLFQGLDQLSNSTFRQAQTLNEPKWKGGAGPLLKRVLVNGNTGLTLQCSLPSDTRSKQSRGKGLLTGESSSSSLFRSEQQEGEKLVLDATGFENIISKIVSDPIQAMGRLLQEMTDHSVSYLKEVICEMVTSEDKRGKLLGLQEVLKMRSDLKIETMSKCPRPLLEILVALKTGLPDVLRGSSNNMSSSDLAEIFLNLKCPNLACRNSLPVDDCECKVCRQRSGFCSTCMCLLCSKFDNASNTCSWVGCDVCIHWCHTDCALQDSRIRNGPRSATEGTTEMQFHCVACKHPSAMFGFVKDVFMTCAKNWKAETLAKELQYARRIFVASNDLNGKKLCALANQMLLKLEDKASLSEVINIIIAFFSESKANISNNPSINPPKEPSINIAEGSNGGKFASKRSTWLPSFSMDKFSDKENTGALPILDYKDAEVQMKNEKNPVVDELESIVRFKQAEAKMYQERADSARREAEGLRRIARVKNAQIEEDYATHIAKLQVGQAEESRRKKFEEVKVIERAHREYFNMKMRMEAEINDLLVKMEAEINDLLIKMKATGRSLKK